MKAVAHHSFHCLYPSLIQKMYPFTAGLTVFLSLADTLGFGPVTFCTIAKCLKPLDHDASLLKKCTVANNKSIQVI